ncbi:hypothetical protein FPV67DRAFT_760650 [Lyophyllum atratum]|nr:hypothetical protein FPV67DRAFT_760650 [Lyophyllum atratum]
MNGYGGGSTTTVAVATQAQIVLGVPCLLDALLYSPKGTTDMADRKKGEPWFEDGNILLVTDEPLPTTFRVHRGVLGRHSEVFEGMFSIPQPSSTSNPETFDGCQVVRMYDLPTDLSNLIMALYDGANFRNHSFDDFAYLAGILRLSTKYFISHLRAQAIRFLTETWPYTLKGHDTMVAKALATPSSNGLSYPYVHPLHVLNLANEVNIQVIVPSALYFLSLYPLADILRTDHPKLLVKHPSNPSSTLSPTDIGAYTLMFQYRLKVILEFIRGDHPLSPQCNNDTCKRGFQKVASLLFRSWMTRTGPLYFIFQAISAIDEEPYLCEHCRKRFRRDAHDLRDRIWNELPSVVGLPPWEDLLAADLPT